MKVAYALSEKHAYVQVVTLKRSEARIVNDVLLVKGLSGQEFAPYCWGFVSDGYVDGLYLKMNIKATLVRNVQDAGVRLNERISSVA